MTSFRGMPLLLTLTAVFACGSDTPNAPDPVAPVGTFALLRVDGSMLPTQVTTRLSGPITLVGDTLVLADNGNFAITSVAITGTPVFTITGSSQMRGDSVFLFEEFGGGIVGRGLVGDNIIEIRSEGSHQFVGHLLEYHRTP